MPLALLSGPYLQKVPEKSLIEHWAGEALFLPICVLFFYPDIDPLF